MIIFKSLPISMYQWDSLRDNDQTRKDAESRLYKDPGDVIQFPMTGSLSETNAVNWTDDTISEIQNIAAGIAYNRI